MIHIKIKYYRYLQCVTGKLLQSLVLIHGGSSRRLVELNYMKHGGN